MQLNLNIKAFGKLKDAKIRTGNFTVFAGPNNTGKSYVSKLLYSLFNAMNANHAEVMLHHLIGRVPNELRGFLQRINQMRPLDRPESEKTLSDIVANAVQIQLSILDMQKAVASCSDDNVKHKDMLGALGNIHPELIKAAERIKEAYDRLERILESGNKDMELPVNIREDLDRMELGRHVCNLHKKISSASLKDFIAAGIGINFRRNLIRNFQVSDFAALGSGKDGYPVISIEGIGEFDFAADEMIVPEKFVGMHPLRKYSRVIYLESPVYWKLKSALDDIAINPGFHATPAREKLISVPGYYYDLSSALRAAYSGDVAFPDLLEKLTGQEMLGGNIAISELGELEFRENGSSSPLSLTAVGVINLGILALLIERKVIDEDCLIFIDEPEAHLHPAWQVKMAQVLFELARRGVDVVIATHSADILKWIEVHTKENPGDRELIVLNHFTARGVENDRQDFEALLAGIKSSLTEPFANLYLQGLNL